MMAIPNIHTHFHRPNNSSDELFVFDPSDPHTQLAETVQYYVAGVHPWSQHPYTANRLEQALKDPRCLGLGEVGLDSLQGLEEKKQRELLSDQLELAQALSVKRVVLHCVRAYDELLKIILPYQFSAVLWHDYNGHEAFTKKCLTLPGHSFSFGKSLFRNSSKMKLNCQLIPLDRIFVETDDDKEGPELEELLQQLSEIKKISSHDLKIQIEKNWRTFKC